MAEVDTDDTAMLVDGAESDISSKLLSVQDNPPNQNGLDSEDGTSLEKLAPQNGVYENHKKEITEKENMETEVDKDSDKPMENGDRDKDVKDAPGSVEGSVSAKSDDTPVVLSDNPESETVESVGSPESPVIVNSSQGEENSTEAMEIDSKDDEDSNVVEVSSNVSVPNSDVVDVGSNNSDNPSIISEDSSRDSLESNESKKSENSSETNEKESLVGTVKDDDGDEILITLNDEDEGDKEKEDVDSKCEEKELNENKKDLERNETEKKDIAGEKKEKPVDVKVSSFEKAGSVQVSKIAPAKVQPTAVVAASSVPAATTLLFPVSAGTPQSIIVQGAVSSERAEYRLIRQGNQLGYITVVGNQRLFVPVTGTVEGAAPKNPVIANQLQVTQEQKKVVTPVKPEDLLPKASWEMIELMRWEIQNRIPDNYNWSVAFHGR